MASFSILSFFSIWSNRHYTRLTFENRKVLRKREFFYNFFSNFFVQIELRVILETFYFTYLINILI